MPHKPVFDLSAHVPTQGELGKLFGIAARTVRNRIDAGELAPMGSPLTDHIEAWSGADPKRKAASERARLVKAQADIAEVKLSQLRGEVVPVEDVEAALVARLTEVRASFIALPGKLGPELANITDKNEATALVEAELFAAMSSIAEGQFDRIIDDAKRRAAASVQNDDAAAEADALAVD